jgi:fructosamine-3-kinase
MAGNGADALPSFAPAGAVRAQRLAGGAAHSVWLMTMDDGSRTVVKATAGVDPDVYLAEAEGLRTLRVTGGVLTPRVLEVTESRLVLQALLPPPSDGGFWADAGRAVAELHAVRGERFGWRRDGWLGRLPQRNGWHQDGHAFFAERRLLRYLAEPLVQGTLDPRERATVERICERLPELVPVMPPVLTHGDLSPSNIVSTDLRKPVFIDPAVCWMWAEADLSTMYCAEGAPDRFFAAYAEVRPLIPEWRERMPLLHLRELLSTVAHFGERCRAVVRLREILRRYGG